MNDNRTKDAALDQQMGELLKTLTELEKLIAQRQPNQPGDSAVANLPDIVAETGQRMMAALAATLTRHPGIDPVALTMTILTLVAGNCMASVLAHSSFTREWLIARHAETVGQFLDDFETEGKLGRMN